MEFNKKVILKDGRECTIRNGTEEDAQAVLSVFVGTHGETDYMTTYPDEMTLTLEQEKEYLKKKTEHPREAELLAEVDGTVVGTAGIDMIGRAEKVRHRASFGIGILKDWWGLGIGRALIDSCIECAKAAGFVQLELEVVANNDRAVALYKKAGFVESGRNPRGFCSRTAGMQEIVSMIRPLDSICIHPMPELFLELEDTEWPKTYIDHDRQVARAIVIDDEGYFYFVRAQRDDEFGCCTFIETSGGGVEDGEPLDTAIRRELKEELGANVEVLCKIGVVSDYYNLIHRHNINHYFLCRILALGERHLMEDEINYFHLTTMKLRFEEAVKEYETSAAASRLGRVIDHRELPVLLQAGKLLGIEE